MTILSNLLRIARREARTAPLIVALLLAACAPDPRAESYLAEYIALAGPGVDTTAMFPGPDAERHLSGLPAPPADATLLWLTGTSLQLRFYAVTDAHRTLWVEARPPRPPGAPGQSIGVALGNSVGEARQMEPGWWIYEFPLPAGAIRRGWNSLELRFARTIRPADYDTTSSDQRELVAGLRRLEIRLDGRGGAGDAERQVVVDFGDAAPVPVAGGGADTAAGAGAAPRTRDPSVAPRLRDLSAATVDMPAGSMTEVFLLPRPDTELLGDLSVAPGAPAGDLAVEIEVVGERGEAGEVGETSETSETGPTAIWRGSPSDAWWGSVRVRASLGEWAGRSVALRIRVTGSGRGSVRFTRLRTRSATTAFDERLGIPEAVQVDARALPGERPDIFVVLLDAARFDALFGERGGAPVPEVRELVPEVREVAPDVRAPAPDVRELAPNVRELAPNVRELAAQATSFLQAWSPAAWTGQSVPAVLTGMTPDTLGFTTWESRMPPGFDTLPGALRAAGYYNFLFTQHTFYDPHDELLEDFDEVEIVLIRDRLPDPAHLVDDERPTFAFIHLLPPHDPYTAPEPFAGTRSAWYEGDVDLDLDLLRGFYDVVPADEQDEVRRFALARYEENVAHADDLVGRLIAQLRELGHYDDAIVVLLSDHGEAFGEHGAFLHGGQLFEEAIHVPLVIKLPGGRDAVRAGDALHASDALRADPSESADPARAADSAGPAGAADPAGAASPAGPTSVNTPVSTLDLAPTLLELAGIDNQSARFQGRSLAAALSGEPSAKRLILSQTVDGAWPLYALRWGNLKLIYEQRTRSARLFDLATDPAERNDVAAQIPLQTQALLQALRVALARHEALLLVAGDRATEQLDEETIRRLRALGYLR